MYYTNKNNRNKKHETLGQAEEHAERERRRSGAIMGITEKKPLTKALEKAKKEYKGLKGEYSKTKQHAESMKKYNDITANRLTGYEKDQLRKKFGHNKLTGYEMDYGRKLKGE